MSDEKKITEVEKLDDEILSQVSAAGNLSASDYAEIGKDIAEIIIYLVDRFMPSMPNNKQLNIQSLMQERMEDYIAGDMTGYRVKGKALKVMGVDVANFDKALESEVRKRLGK